MGKSSRLPIFFARSKTPAVKWTAKRIRCFIMTLVLAMLAIHFWAVLLYAKNTKQKHVALPPAQKNEYIMWSKEEAYMQYCQLHYKANRTWGKLHAPFTDKIEAKNIVERMNVPSLNNIPTLAVLDKQNISKYSLEFMKSLKQPYIIKPTHMSGGVARVYNDTYHCFKYCEDENIMPLDSEAAMASQQQLVIDLKSDYSVNGGELQYRYITPRIIFEEDVISNGKTNTDVTFWWLSNGHPVFVSEQCGQPRGNQLGFQMTRVFLGTDHRRLPILFNRGTCKDLPEKPTSWNTQLEIMEKIGKEFPHEVVRIDVYGGGDAVWFSEFTFTTGGCWKKFTPALTDGLLYGLMKKRISPDAATPEYVERMLNDNSWVLLLGEQNLSSSYPSPVDLCLTIEQFNNEGKMKQQNFRLCIRQLKLIQKFSLRCLVSEKNGTKLQSFGVNEPVKDTPNTEVCATKHYGPSGSEA